MILLLRAVARLVTFVLLVALAACGLAIVIFSIGGSRTGDFSLPGLARLVHLGDLRQEVGQLLHDLQDRQIGPDLGDAYSELGADRAAVGRYGV